MRADIRAKLSNGHLMAKGFRSPHTPTTPEVMIPMGEWRFLILDYDDDNSKSQQLGLVDDSQIIFALIYWWRTMEVRHGYCIIVARGLFKASQLRAVARKTKDGPQARRLLTLAAIYDGATRTEAAKIGGVTLQIIRDWVMRFNARGASGLLDGKSPGQPTRLNVVQCRRSSDDREPPIPAIHGVVRWRLIDLSQWVYEEFHITFAKQTLSRGLRALVTPSSSTTPPSCANRGSHRGF